LKEATIQFFIFGCRSTAIEIAETVDLIHPAWNIFHVSEKPDVCLQHQHIVDSDLAEIVLTCRGQHRFIISMADQDLRARYLELASATQLQAQSIVHPQATLSPSAKLGKGSYLAPGSRVSAQASVGDHSILNFNVTFGHNASSGTHLIANPGATIGGNVSLGHQVLLGANAFIYQGLTIGDDCQIDAMTYVGQTLESRTLCTSRQFKTFPRRDI